MSITRRDALKNIAFLPVFTTRGATVSAAHLGAKHFLLFFDAQVVNIEDLMNIRPVPDFPLDAVIYYVPLKLRHEQTIEDAIRLYEVSDGVRP